MLSKNCDNQWKGAAAELAAAPFQMKKSSVLCASRSPDAARKSLLIGRNTAQALGCPMSCVLESSACEDEDGRGWIRVLSGRR